MATNFDDLKKGILSLSTQEKATLVHALLADIDTEVDENAEALWIEEAQSRYESYRRGELQSAPGKEAMQRARERLK